MVRNAYFILVITSLGALRQEAAVKTGVTRIFEGRIGLTVGIDFAISVRQETRAYAVVADARR